MTHEEKAECEWRESLVLQDLKALERRRLEGEKGLRQNSWTSRVKILHFLSAL